MQFQRGDFVEIDGLLAVVVGTEGDDEVPDDHIAVWFGDPETKRISRGGSGGARLEVWTVPVDVCRFAAKSYIQH